MRATSRMSACRGVGLACALVASGCEDLSGLASASSAPTEDGGRGAGDAGSPDGGGATDARGWCETQPAHYFCDDFDAARAWTREQIFRGGAFGTTTEAVSAPAALAVTLPPGAPGSDSGAFKVRAIPVTAKRVTLSADVWPCALTSGTTFYLNVQTVSQGNHTANVAVGEVFDAGDAPTSVVHLNDFDDGSLGSANLPGPPLPRDTWSHVTLVVELSATKGSIKGSRDGQELGAVSTPTEWPSPISREAWVGAMRIGTDGCEARVDNVTVDVE